MNTYQEEEALEQAPQFSRVTAMWIVVGALGAVAFMGIGVLVGGGWLGGVQPGLDRRVYVAEGMDSTICSDDFEVADSWELRWQHTGELREICWTDQDGTTQCYTAMPRKPIRPHGSVNVSRGGRFTLRVEGTGKWRLEVYRL